MKSMKPMMFKHRADDFFKELLEHFVFSAAGAGYELPGEREIAKITGESRQATREYMAILKYAGIIDCQWGKKQVLTMSAVDAMHILGFVLE